MCPLDRAAAWLILAVAAAGLSPGEARAIPGDSFEDPLLIAALPFLVTGTTCGFADDIALACSSSPEGAPDVVYRYVADLDRVVTISTCGSSYLVTFTVFDGTGEIVSCAPTYCLNGGYAWQVELTGGSTYDIVVDSESPSPCGGYILSMDECPAPHSCDPVIVRCPPGAHEEGENTCVPGYVDDFNRYCYLGGCPSSPVPCTGADVTICGTIGVNGSNQLDSDTYEFVQSAPSHVTIEVSGGKATIFVRLVREVDGSVIEEIVSALRLTHGTIFDGVLDPGRYLVQLVMDSRYRPSCENPSLIHFAGLSCTPGPTPTQRSSWGQVKAGYR